MTLIVLFMFAYMVIFYQTRLSPTNKFEVASNGFRSFISKATLIMPKPNIFYSIDYGGSSSSGTYGGANAHCHSGSSGQFNGPDSSCPYCNPGQYISSYYGSHGVNPTGPFSGPNAHSHTTVKGTYSGPRQGCPDCYTGNKSSASGPYFGSSFKPFYDTYPYTSQIDWGYIPEGPKPPKAKKPKHIDLRRFRKNRPMYRKLKMAQQQEWDAYYRYREWKSIHRFNTILKIEEVVLENFLWFLIPTLIVICIIGALIIT